ncbi:succinate dehydrogenase [Selenomonadales bacterium OttesenSCG-928-I06]|nr:succinate dehydrogenase [Selenomonadales bacterium OttesenSCG-928-I06]
MSQGDFLLRRLHSLTGVIPVGLFLLEHIFTISLAIFGAAYFNAATEFFGNIPVKGFIEIFFIAIPLIFHAGYGLYVALLSKNNVFTYSYFRNWTFFLQRITAYIAFVFIIWHVWALRFGGAGLGSVNTFEQLTQIMSDPCYFIIHIIGYLAVVFHFCNGLWGFLITWGITTGEKSQTISQVLCLSLGVLLAALGIVAVVMFKGGI